MLSLPHVILASSSPRRRQLLEQIGVRFEVRPPDIDESQREDEGPLDYAMRLANEKAKAIADGIDEGIVLGSDTIVVLDGEILGKPADRDEAISTLKRLSDRTHTVFTGFSVVEAGSDREMTSYGEAQVTFRELRDDEIEAYVDGGSPMDKAGAYGIQDDLGAVFIERIDGDYYTVVGLPLMKVYLALRDWRRGIDDGKST